MTTIVYRDGVLAGDTRTTAGDTILATVTRKVFKSSSGWLYGAAGHISDIIRFCDWASKYEGGDHKKGPPGGHYTAIVISPAGVIYSVEGGSIWPMEECPYISVGSGSDVAYGALEMGASAERSVGIAIKFDSCSGYPIQTETIE